MKMKCRHCGYEWDSKAKTILVTCPSCGKKTPKERPCAEPKEVKGSDE